MKKLFVTLLLGAAMAHAQVPNPPVYASGPFGPGGVFPALNSGTLIFASDANRTMIYPETSAHFLKVISTVSLTATRNLVAPQTLGFDFVVENATTGGQAIQILGSSGAGVTIANGSTVHVVSDGTNYVSAGGSGGGGAVTSVFGRAGVVVAQTNDYSVSQVNGAAPLASPTFTGTPTAPTPATTDNSTAIATTAYTRAYIASLAYVTGSGTSGHCVQWGASNTLGDAGAACGTSGGGITLLTGDVTTPSGGGSQPATVTHIEGGAIPTSAGYVGTNSGGQLVAPTPLTALNSVPTYEYQNTPKPALAPFTQALQYAQSKAVNILVIGDSYSICDVTNCVIGPTTSTNRWPEQLRIALQARFGSHGTGIVPINQGGNVVNNEAWSVSGTTAWDNSSLGPVDASTTALLHLSNAATATFNDSRAIPWDTLRIYCMTNSTSGSIAISIDGGAYTGTACGTTTGTPTAHVVSISTGLTGPAETTHTVTFTSTGNSYIYAAEGVAGTSGVSVSNTAMGETTSTAYGSSAANQLAFTDADPDGTALAIVMLQTNDVNGANPVSNFATYMGNIVAHEQALSPAASVMLAIPPVSNFDPTGSASAPYTAAQLNLCATTNISCVNVQDHGTTINGTKLGFGTTYNSASASLWDQVHAPGTHPGDQGATDEGALVYQQVLNSFVAQCTANCALVTPTFTAPAGSNYAQTLYSGNSHSYNVGVGMKNESAFGLAGKFYVFDWGAAAPRWAIDSSGNAEVGHTAPLPGTFSRLFNVGTSSQFGVDASGNVLAPTYSSGASNSTYHFFAQTADSNQAYLATTVNSDYAVLYFATPSQTWQFAAGGSATGPFAGHWYVYDQTASKTAFDVTPGTEAVNFTGNITAPSLSLTNTTAPLAFGPAGGYAGPLVVPAFCPGGSAFNLFSFAAHSGNPDRVTLSSCAELDLQSASGIGGFIGDASHPSAIAWDGAGHTTIQSLISGTSSNSDLNGELTLSSGTASETFSSYDSSTTHPICVANDETAESPVRVSYSGGSGVAWTATFHVGSSSDVINYICTGRAN